MPDCRVELREGAEDSPIILVAPHLEEDYCDFIAELVAEKLDTYAVINKGWERADAVDFLKDRANCNDLNQLLADEVAKDEFLLPITRFATYIRRQNFINVFVFIIHGFGANSKDKPDVVLGTGLPDRLSCEQWRRDIFAYNLLETGLDVREGAPNGRFAGRAWNNLNQLFKHKTELWQKDSAVHSFQIEIEHAWRKSQDTARVIAEALWKSITNLVEMGDIDLRKIKTLEKIDLRQW